MPNYLTPGVYFETVDVSRKGITAIRTDIAAFVGITERGPLHQPTSVSSWEQFQAALEAKGYRGLIPLLPHPSRSVITDWLEREQPVVQIHEYAEPMLSLQVIWGNGEEFVTGSASINTFRDPEHPECVADGVVPDGPGPMNFDEFLYGSQGTMGVVTWGKVKMAPKPKVSKTFLIPFENLEDAAQLVYNVQLRMIGSECLILNSEIQLPIEFSQGSMYQTVS